MRTAGTPSLRGRRIALALIAATAAIVTLGADSRSQPAPRSGAIRGTVVADIPDRNESGGIALPQARVFLRRATGETLAGSETVTNASGRFLIGELAPGSYQVCAERANFRVQCAGPVPVNGQLTGLPRHLALRPSGGVLHGRLFLRDGSPLGDDGLVTLNAAGGRQLAGPVPTDSAGRYVLAVPGAAEGVGTLAVKYQDARTTVPVVLSAGNLAGREPVDVVINNTRPRIDSLIFTQNGEAVTEAAAGSTVEVSVAAEDPDGNALHYRWSDSAGAIETHDAASLRWTLPDAVTTNLMFVEVSDNKGGVTQASAALTTVARQKRTEAPALFQIAGLPPPGPSPKPGPGNPWPGPYFPPPPHPGKFIDPANLVEPCGPVADDPNCSNEAIKYYISIGVYDAGISKFPNKPAFTLNKDRGTFAAWKTTNGFNANPNTPNADERRAIYYNKTELGYGRDAHCRNKGGFPQAQQYITCYVTNYSDATGLPGGDAQAAIANAAANTNALFTLAIEWHIVNGVQRFIAYGADGKPLTRVVLDSEGPKQIPGVCTACHGGGYSATNHDHPGSQVFGAYFLPFDTPVLAYAADPNSPQSEANQRENLRMLNSIVAISADGLHQVMPTIATLIAGWYGWCGGVGTVNCTIDDAAHPFIPSGACGGNVYSFESCGWSSAIPGYTAQQLKDAYQIGPRVYCRSCHVAKVAGFNVQNFYAFANSSVKAPVFGQGYTVMPDAEILYNKFWSGYPSGNPGRSAMNKLLSKLYP